MINEVSALEPHMFSFTSQSMNDEETGLLNDRLDLFQLDEFNSKHKVTRDIPKSISTRTRFEESKSVMREKKHHIYPRKKSTASMMIYSGVNQGMESNNTEDGNDQVKKRRFPRRNSATSEMLINGIYAMSQTEEENHQVKKRRFSRRNSVTAKILRDGICPKSPSSEELFSNQHQEIQT